MWKRPQECAPSLLWSRNAPTGGLGNAERCNVAWPGSGSGTAQALAEAQAQAPAQLLALALAQAQTPTQAPPHGLAPNLCGIRPEGLGPKSSITVTGAHWPTASCAQQALDTNRKCEQKHSAFVPNRPIRVSNNVIPTGSHMGLEVPRSMVQSATARTGEPPTGSSSIAHQANLSGVRQADHVKHSLCVDGTTRRLPLGSLRIESPLYACQHRKWGEGWL